MAVICLPPSPAPALGADAVGSAAPARFPFMLLD